MFLLSSHQLLKPTKKIIFGCRFSFLATSFPCFARFPSVFTRSYLFLCARSLQISPTPESILIDFRNIVGGFVGAHALVLWFVTVFGESASTCCQLQWSIFVYLTLRWDRMAGGARVGYFLYFTQKVLVSWSCMFLSSQFCGLETPNKLDCGKIAALEARPS